MKASWMANQKVPEKGAKTAYQRASVKARQTAYRTVPVTVYWRVLATVNQKAEGRASMMERLLHM